MSQAKVEKASKPRSKSVRRGPGKHWKDRPAFKLCRDGREICNLATLEGEHEYKRRIWLMWVRQEGLCCNCREPLRMKDASFEHQDCRGMGGARRDDRIAIFDDEGRFVRHVNGASHIVCNSRRGSVRTEIYHGNNVWFEVIH